MHGIMKNAPGPFEPLPESLPSLKMTALSYCATTFKQNGKQNGNVQRHRRYENRTRTDDRCRFSADPKFDLVIRLNFNRRSKILKSISGKSFLSTYRH